MQKINNLSRRGFLRLLGLTATTVLLGSVPKVETFSAQDLDEYMTVKVYNLLDPHDVRSRVVVTKRVNYTRWAARQGLAAKTRLVEVSPTTYWSKTPTLFENQS